jgi:hypothetical protein
MTDDLVKRLRSPTEHETWLWSVPFQAADRIEALKREIARKDAALGHIYAWYPISVIHPNTTLNDIREFARAALVENNL